MKSSDEEMGLDTRGSLGTRNQDVARRSIHKLETALAEGPLSPLWQELQMILPSSTYRRFADVAGVKVPHLPTWAELHTAFTVFMEQRIIIGKLARSTADRYKLTFREFGAFLAREGVSLLKDISRPLVERFKVRRVQQITQKNSLAVPLALSSKEPSCTVFFPSLWKMTWFRKIPFVWKADRVKTRRGGAEPFTAAELSKMLAKLVMTCSLSCFFVEKARVCQDHTQPGEAED